MERNYYLVLRIKVGLRDLHGLQDLTFFLKNTLLLPNLMFSQVGSVISSWEVPDTGSGFSDTQYNSKERGRDYLLNKSSAGNTNMRSLFSVIEFSPGR